MGIKRTVPLKRSRVRAATVCAGAGTDELETSELIVTADLAVRHYLMRTAFGDSVKCFTCPTVGGWAHMEVGHFIKRSIYLTRWDIRNVKPQCPKCNHAGGRTDVYAAALETLQPGLPDELRLASHRPFRLTRDFILSQIQSLR